MKTILIPTDFDEVSVHRTHDLLDSMKNESVKIIFFHAYKITDSISDLLMLSRRTAEYGQISETFHKACYNLQKTFKNKVDLLSIEYFYGSTMAAFRNFAEAHNVSHIHYPEAYQYKKISKYSIDPLTFLNRSGIPVLTVEIEPVSQENLTSELCY
jgi:hypothetical protein